MTPLKEGELVVKGFIYNLCIESNQSSRSSSPLIAGVSKANSLTLSLNSRDSLYQVLKSYLRQHASIHVYMPHTILAVSIRCSLCACIMLAILHSVGPSGVRVPITSCRGCSR